MIWKQVTEEMAHSSVGFDSTRLTKWHVYECQRIVTHILAFACIAATHLLRCDGNQLSFNVNECQYHRLVVCVTFAFHSEGIWAQLVTNQRLIMVNIRTVFLRMKKYRTYDVQCVLPIQTTNLAIIPDLNKHNTRQDQYDLLWINAMQCSSRMNTIQYTDSYKSYNYKGCLESYRYDVPLFIMNQSHHCAFIRIFPLPILK